MLIGESIIIGEVVKVAALERRGKSIKFGITAPRAIAIYREEIFNALKEKEVQETKTREEQKP